MKFNLEYLEKLANIVYDNDLSEITLEDDEQAISIKREKPQQASVAPVVMPATVTSHVVAPQPKSAEQEKAEVHKGKPITAPMVGTFYAAPSPDDAPFVKVGDNIAIGQVVCIIEAMKLMNEIEAEASGQITEICVKNGESVEFGQVLMYVE
ncbi:acetyl-CoA carboxylase biotin carboxyl carrier protein [bacterium]|nr:acetyl-CoA carboxylase biotin carboxyl carrier protein [bacterium]